MLLYPDKSEDYTAICLKLLKLKSVLVLYINEVNALIFCSKHRLYQCCPGSRRRALTLKNKGCRDQLSFLKPMAIGRQADTSYIIGANLRQTIQQRFPLVENAAS